MDFMSRSQSRSSLMQSPQKEEGSVAFSEIEHIHDQSDLRFLLGLRSNRKFLGAFGEEEDSLALQRTKNNNNKKGKKLNEVGRIKKQVKDMLSKQRELRKVLHNQETEASDWEEKLEIEQDIIADLEEEYENVLD